MRRRIFPILVRMASALSPVLAGDNRGGSNPGPGSSSGGRNDGGKDRQDDRQQDRREDRTAPGDSTAGEDRNRTSLTATAAGQTINAKAVVDIRVRGERQRFKVELKARVNDGATFLVMANGQAAGTLVMTFGEGEIEISNEDGCTLPAAVNPVNAVRQVSILAGGMVIAEGNL